LNQNYYESGVQLKPEGSSVLDARRYIIGIAVVFLLSLVIFYFVMHPPMDEIGLMALFLSITGAISILAGFLAYRLGWIERSPTILWTILAGYILSSLLTFINVWLTARLMFTDLHDFLLATVLLVFASGIAITFGYFFAGTFTRRIRALEHAARHYAEGNFTYRVEVKGNDELAKLANSVNEMAGELSRSEQKKLEVEKLRRDLVAWTSHDLQTPLASVQAILEALADGIVDDAEMQARYLHTAQKDIRHLSVLIDDLFQLAQIDAGGLQLEKEIGSISDLVSDTLETFRELAEKNNLQIVGEVQLEVDPVYMDTLKIGRVLNNLISNALRYAPVNSEILVRVFRQDEGVRIEVVDHGPGIQAQDLPFLFERFYRGEKSRNRASGGAGLGLAISKGIVEAHDGKIDVDSIPDEKTCFWFWLPTSKI
jgi:signal transduction histidine kinase